MPTSGSSSISSAIRCSADRPWMPNASRSPRTRCTCLSGADPAQRGAALGQQHQALVARELASRLEVERAVVVQLVELGALDLELGHAGVAGVGVADRLAAVLLGVEADGRRLDPQRQVLADQRDVGALVGEVAGDGQDPGVVVTEPEAGRQRVGVGVVELDPDRPALVADRHRLVEAAVGHPHLVEHPQRRAGEVAQLRMVPLALELGDHDDREHDLVLREAAQGAGIGEQHAGVEDVGTDGRLLRHGIPPGAASFPARRYCESTPGREPRSVDTPDPGATGW